MVRTELVYASVEPKNGTRILVGRRWPRGTGEKLLRMDSWYEGVALSSQLGKWFNHDAASCDEVKKRCFAGSASSTVARSATAVLVSSGEVMLL